MKRLLLLVFPFLFGSFALPGRLVHEFDIKKAGIKVGTLTATLHTESDIRLYHINSQSSAWVGTKIWVYHRLRAVYDKHKLLRADIEIKSSKGNYNSWVVWKKDHYEYDVQGMNFKRCGKLNVPVTFSIAKMYFQEPVSEKEIFTENHAEIVKLVRASHHAFQVGTGAKPNTFYFNKGRLEKAEMTSSSMSYTIERAE